MNSSFNSSNDVPVMPIINSPGEQYMYSAPNIVESEVVTRRSIAETAIYKMFLMNAWINICNEDSNSLPIAHGCVEIQMRSSMWKFIVNCETVDKYLQLLDLHLSILVIKKKSLQQFFSTCSRGLNYNVSQKISNFYTREIK